MATALIYGAPGSGKTINTTRLPGKTLLLSSDNSSLVLKNFERPNLTIKEVKSYQEFVDAFNAATTNKQFDNIIVDCLTDIIDAYIVEVRQKGFSGDIRQYYLSVYTGVKALVRQAAYCDTNVVFNCWDDISEKTTPSGEIVSYLAPALPLKIRNNVCGLCNIVGYVSSAADKNGNKQWFFVTDGDTNRIMVKDQLFMRKSCMPENLFAEAKK